MLHYRLRTLLIVVTLGPPLLALAWFVLRQIEFWLALFGAIAVVILSSAVVFAAAFAIVAAGIWIATIVGERFVRLLDR